MIKIIPYGGRELTRKSLAKLWNLFPDEEFCVTGITRDLDQLFKLKRIAYYYTLRGKDFSVEIDPDKLSFEVEHLLRIGVRKFYFPWRGLERKAFFYSSSVLQYAMWLVDTYKDAEVTIIYDLEYKDIYHPPDFDQIETSLTFLGKLTKEKTGIKGVFRRCHPWYGKQRISDIQKLEKLALREGVSIENECGCLTVSNNTSIYCCPFCERKKRKKLFGNADRDKYVCGTVDLGIFRDVICSHCELSPNAKSKRITYISRG